MLSSTQITPLVRSLRSWARSQGGRLEEMLTTPPDGAPQQLKDSLVLVQRALKDFQIELAEAGASPKQLAFQQTFLDQKHHRYVSLGANRSGKSFVAGVLCFCKWLRDRAKNGEEYWCVAPGEKTVGQQQLLWQFLPRAMFKPGTVFDGKWGFGRERPAVELVLPGKRGVCLVRFKTCDQDDSSFEQGKLKGWWADESMPKHIWDRLIPRTLDLAGWGLYSDIPEQDWHWFDLLKARPEAGIHCVIFAMADNAENLPPGAIAEALGLMSKDEADMRVYGKFRRLSGVVYREFDPEIHICRPFPIPADWPKFRALDYGGSSPTACGWYAIAPNECIYLYREYYQRMGNIQTHAAAIREMSLDEAFLPERFDRQYIDPHAFDTSPSSQITIAQGYAAENLHFMPWPFVNVMGERAMVERVKRRLDNQRFKVFSNCENTIREFAAWKYKVDKNGNPLASDAFEKSNNHMLDTIKGFIGTNPCFASQKFGLL